MDLRSAAFAAKAHALRRGTGATYRELLANQRLPPDELRALQWGRATETVDVAVRETAFYRRLYAPLGIVPGTRLRPEDWSRLPVLDRSTVKANAADMASSAADPRTSRPAVTGGTTGQPLRTLHDARVPSLPLAWRMYGWWGVSPWDDLARVGRWGFGRLDTVRNDLTWWPTRQVYLDARMLSPASMRRFHRDLDRIRPALVEGYVGAMLEFADFMEAENLRIRPPRAVATTAAPLTPPARARLESVFGTAVFDEYRSAEGGWMAGECREQDGLHIFADVRMIEVVDADGRPLPPGETGDIVVTDLTNRVFPLIRYRVGDRGALIDGACRCGISLPRMQQPDGRDSDTIRLPGGRAVGQRLMATFGDHPDSVRLFQIHQQADYTIVVRVVPGDGPDARTHIEQAVQVLRRRVHDAVPVTLEYVDSLPHTGGKVKFLISDVPSERASA